MATLTAKTPAYARKQSSKKHISLIITGFLSFIPFFNRALIRKDLIYLIRTNKGLKLLFFTGIILNIVFILTIESFHNTIQIIAFSNLILLFVISNLMFTTTDKNCESLSLLSSLPLSHFRIWYSKFFVSFFIQLLVILFSLLPVLFHKGIVLNLIIKSYLFQIIFALYLSSVQTNFNIISHEYHRISRIFYNLFLFLVIIFWYIVPLYNLIFFLAGPSLIIKAMSVLKRGEFTS